MDDGDISDENLTRDRTTDETAHSNKDQEGNGVVDTDGERVGILTEIDHGVIHVDPDPSFTERLLGVGDADEGDVVIEEEHIELIEGDEVRLSREGQEDVEREAN